ncbi:MAG: type II secretion system protein GspK [Planctomycetota bacterium]|nr:type II secretion system protein GspK [Planctomycetota bacterium]
MRHRMERHATTRCGRRVRRSGGRGTVLIVTMWILLVLAGLVLVLARAMRVEAERSANEVAAAQAAAVEDGAIQYVMSCVDGLKGAVPVDADTPCEAVPVGDGVFWILRPSSDDERTYSFGTTDESSKVNLNTAPLAILQRLPGMTTEFAASIVDWRDTNSDVTSGGAESEYYLRLPDPYECKNGPLETVEELFLIRGVTKDVLFGQDVNRNGVIDAGESASPFSGTFSSSGSRLDRGIYNLVTVYGAQPATGGSTSGGGKSGGGGRTTTTPTGLINVGTAPKEVLLCLPGLEESDVAALLSKRTASSTDLTSTLWVFETLSRDKAVGIRTYITAKTYQFSADIVSIAASGRAFRRCRVVIDSRTSPPVVVYRQDLTHLGWPLPQEIIAGLRSGMPLEQVVQTSSRRVG